jgi:hypothetical protein
LSEIASPRATTFPTELEPDAKPGIRGAGELKVAGQGSHLTVTVPVMERNFRLFKIEQR